MHQIVLEGVLILIEILENNIEHFHNTFTYPHGYHIIELISSIKRCWGTVGCKTDLSLSEETDA